MSFDFAKFMKLGRLPELGTISSLSVHDQRELARVVLPYVQFENRETYLVWLKEWRDAYREQYRGVHDTREARKYRTGEVQSEAQSRREFWRVVGHNLMFIRRQSKFMAQVQYLMQNKKVAVTA